MSRENYLPKPIGSNLMPSRLQAIEVGSATDPAISFHDELSSGWYLNKDGEIVFTSYGEDNIVQNYYYTEFKRPVVLSDIEALPDVELPSGMLYKKKDSPGLWWKTLEGEINLAGNDLHGSSGLEPMRLITSKASEPSYSFSNDTTTGMYMQNPGNLSLSASGVESLRVNKDLIKTYVPIEISDAGVFNAPPTELSGYLYKKPGEQGLWWKTTTDDVDITATFPKVFKMDDGKFDAPIYSFASDAGTGLYYNSNSNGMGVSVRGSTVVEFKQDDLLVKTTVKAVNGSASRPAFSFNSSGNTGMFQSMPGKVSFAANGVHTMDMDIVSIKTLLPVLLTDGSAASPAIKFTSDLGTGIYLPSINAVGFVASNTEIARITPEGFELKTGRQKLPGGSVGAPAYTFTENNKTGVYYNNESLNIAVNGDNAVKFKSDAVETQNPIRAADSTIGTPQYSFVSSPGTGLCYDHELKKISLNITGTNKSISVDSEKVKISGPIEIVDNANSTGRLYKRVGSDALIWNVNGVEIDITDRRIVQDVSMVHNSAVTVENGSSEEPSYAFSNDGNTGLYRVSDDVVGVSTNAKTVLTMGFDKVELKSVPLVFNDGDSMGSLYKKAGSDSLYWNVNGTETDLLEKGVNFPLRSVDKGDAVHPAYSFADDKNTGLYLNDDSPGLGISIKGSNVMSVDSQKIRNELPVEIKESVMSAPDSSHYGRLYKESGTGHLMWNSTDLGQVCITRQLDRYSAKCANNMHLPDFNFTTDTDTGMYSVAPDVLGFATGGAISLAISDKQTILYNTCVIKDTELSTPAITGEGHLYKKTGSNGLFWNTVTGNEVDLTQVRFPLNSTIDGGAINPTYSFANEMNTGIYRNASGGLGVSVGGVSQLLLTSNFASFNKPIEIKESLPSFGEDNTGRLYKRVGSDALIWNVNGNEVDVTARLNYPTAAPDGSSSAPSYSFSDESTLGIYRAGPGVLSIISDLETIARFAGTSVKITPKLELANSLQIAGMSGGPVYTPLNTGQLYKKTGSNGLFWKTDTAQEIDLTNAGISYDGGVVNNPVILSKGTAYTPSLTFTGSEKTGLYHQGSGDDQVVGLSIASVCVAKFGLNGMYASSGTVDAPGYSFINNPKQGMFITTDKKLGISGGLTANITLGSNSTRINTRLYIKDSNESGDEVSDNYGGLYKIAGDDNLYWEVPGKNAIALGSGLSYPLNAPNGSAYTPSFAFANAKNAGMYLDSTGRVVIGKDSAACGVFNNSRIYSASFGSVAEPTYSFDRNTTDGIALVADGDKHIAVVVNAKKGLNIYDDRVQSDNPIVSGYAGRSDKPSIAVSGVNAGNAGLYRASDTELAVSTGVTEAVRFDEHTMTVSRNILLKSGTTPLNPEVDTGYIFKKSSPDDNLYWKTFNKEVSMTPSCGIELIAGEHIKPGDVVGFDTMTSSKIVKSKGGFGEMISSFNIGELIQSRFASADGESLIISLSNSYDNGVGDTAIHIHGVWIKDADMMKINEISLTAGLKVPGNLSECYCSIVEIDPVNKWYVVSVVVNGDNTIHLRKVQFTVDHKLNLDDSNSEITKILPGVVSVYDSAYDPITDTLICVSYVPVDMNFTTALILCNSGSGETLNVNGTVNTTVSSDMIADSNKQLHVVSLPGQVAIISYGNHKTSFIAMAYDAPITTGETIIDYDSFDCVDMYYDNIENMLICLEKTITPSCFIQAIDVLGTKMQRVSSKNFKNQTMEPFGFAYNSLTCNYTMLYGDTIDSANMYYTMFTFDGDEFTLGMQYSAGNGVYVEHYGFRKGKKVFSLSNRTVLGFWSGTNSVCMSRFLDGYSSYPTAFVGVASNEAISNGRVFVVPRGTIYNTKTDMDRSWLGKKLYLCEFNSEFPNNLSTVSMNNSFVGTCVGYDKILLGM